MKRHRFDPYSFVFGALFAGLGALLLDTDLDMGDVAGAGWLPLPAVALGLVLLALGLDRARPGPSAAGESPPSDEAEQDRLRTDDSRAVHGASRHDLDL